MGNLFSRFSVPVTRDVSDSGPTTILLDDSLAPNTAKLKHTDFELPKDALYATWEAGNTLNGKTRNNLVNAFLTAYNYHLPLVLRAEDIMLAISQVVTTYVNQNADALRGKLVAHEGKKALSVELSSLDWSEFIDRTAALVDANTTTKLSKLMRPSFSTMSPVARTVSGLATMSTFKAYFEYTFVLCCGIPSVVLEGSVEDWVDLRQRYWAIKKELPDLHWWYKFFDRVLDLLVDAKVRGFATSEDKLVWQKCITLEPQGSGGDRLLCGWVHLFAPFQSDGKRLYGDDFAYTALDPDYTPKLDGWGSPATDFSNGWREIAASEFDVGVKLVVEDAEKMLTITAGALGHHVSREGVRVSQGYVIRERK